MSATVPTLPTFNTTLAPGIAGTSEDWLTAACEIGTYKDEAPYEGAFAAARCIPRGEVDRGTVIILRFGSDFLARNFLASNRLYGYYTTSTENGATWLFTGPSRVDRAYLEPLEQFGFTIMPPPIR